MFCTNQSRRARADSGSTAAAFSFAGEQRDDETGLINLRARYYDPGIGRFLSRDSLPGVTTIPQSWNRFSYVENDPINATDPSGHKKKIKWPNGQDPDDDADRAAKKAKKCKNPGQYTGSCKGGPPNAAYAAHGEADDAAKKAGQAAAAGNLAAAIAYFQSSAHFSSIAGTAAAWTATLQAYASILAASQSIQVIQAVDNDTESFEAFSLSLQASIVSTQPEGDACNKYFCSHVDYDPNGDIQNIWYYGSRGAYTRGETGGARYWQFYSASIWQLDENEGMQLVQRWSGGPEYSDNRNDLIVDSPKYSLPDVEGRGYTSRNSVVVIQLRFYEPAIQRSS